MNSHVIDHMIVVHSSKSRLGEDHSDTGRWLSGYVREEGVHLLAIYTAMIFLNKKYKIIPMGQRGSMLYVSVVGLTLTNVPRKWPWLIYYAYSIITIYSHI